MEVIDHFCRVRIVFLVELHRVPSVLAPILPVLNDKVDRNLLLTEAACSCKEFLLVVESLTAVDVSECP